MITSFPPIVQNDAQVLILGTMPGVQSLEKQQYYGHPQNHFWRVIYGLYGLEKPAPDYVERVNFLQDKRIALWDVLSSCDREGSSDAKILNPVPNDFDFFFKQYIGIKAVCFNGGKAEDLFHKLVREQQETSDGLCYYRLPSTSPAHAIPFSKKLENWRVVLQLLSGGTCI